MLYYDCTGIFEFYRNVIFIKYKEEAGKIAISKSCKSSQRKKKPTKFYLLFFREEQNFIRRETKMFETKRQKRSTATTNLNGVAKIDINVKQTPCADRTTRNETNAGS